MKHLKNCISYFLPLLLALLTACTGNSNKQNDSGFEPTLQKHLAAIKATDLPALLSTVDDSVTLILPNGKIINSKKEYETFHTEWFAEKNWSVNYEIISKHETPVLSYALTRYVYKEIDSVRNNSSRKAYLQLIFRKTGDKWLLFYDQNTRIIQ